MKTEPQKKEKKILFFILLLCKMKMKIKRKPELKKSVFIFLIEGLRVFDPEKKHFFLLVVSGFK